MGKSLILKKINIFILSYVCILSFVFILFDFGINWYYLLWIIIDNDVLLFIYTPFVFLLLQIFLKKKYFNDVSIFYLIINAIFISLLSYLFFYAIAMIFILLGIKGG